MKKTITILSLLVAFTCYSQTAIKKESIDSGGGIATAGTLKIIHTIGEIVVQENTVGTLHISEGFISPETLNSLDLQDYTTLTRVRVFPNPTTDYIHINFSEIAHYMITIFNYQGKQLATMDTNETDTQTLNMLTYSAGVYLVVLKNTAKQQYKVYKVVKK